MATTRSTAETREIPIQLTTAVVLPVQYSAPRTIASPERELMLAVLEDAIRCFEDLRRTPGGRRRRVARQAEVWLLDDDRSWPFSFSNVCEALGFEPLAVRRALMMPGPREIMPPRRKLSRLRVRMRPHYPRPC